MITISYDEEDGIACTVANGLASVEDFDAYLPLALDYMARSRARHGRSLHLVDAAANPVQSRDVFDHMAEASRQTLKPGDICAVVLHSTLARLQINRMGDDFTRQFFADQDSARQWLLDQVRLVEARA